jgi:ribose transport system substrate-binding protein
MGEMSPESNVDHYDTNMHGGAGQPRHLTTRGTRRVLAICAVAVSGALALAACSGGGGDTPADAPPSVVSVQMLTSLRATISAAEQPPVWTAPGPAVKASAVRGKSALVMAVNDQIDACQTQATDFQQLGQQLGLNVTQYNTVGVPQQWAGGIQAAASNRDNAVVMLCGIPGPAVPPVMAQMTAAHRAGLRIVDGNYNEVPPNLYAGLDAETAVNTIQGITDDVDDAILQQNGKALHALVVSSDSIVQGVAATQAATTEVNRVCPHDCSVIDLVVPIQNWFTQLQGQVHADLVAHPDINAVIIVFDGEVQFAIPAVQQVRRLGLEIYTWGGSRTVESYMLQRGSLIAADPGPDENWDAYESMDQVIRLLGGHPAASVDSEVSPNRFWTPQNVAEFFGPAGTYGNEGFGGNAFINGFRQLWGLPPGS